MMSSFSATEMKSYSSYLEGLTDSIVNNFNSYNSLNSSNMNFNAGNFQPNSSDYTVSSSNSEDSWSMTSSSPDTIAYSSGEEQYAMHPAQYQLQQHCQFSSYSPNSQWYQCCPHYQQPNQYHLSQYNLNPSYSLPMYSSYQAMNQQEVSFQMTQRGPSVVSRQGVPVTASIPPVTSCPAVSPPNQISSTNGSALEPLRRRATGRAKANKISSQKKNNDILHPCPNCGRRFKNKSNIKTHMRTHSKEKPFVCAICQKAFTQKAHLTKHVAIHNRQSAPPTINITIV